MIVHLLNNYTGSPLVLRHSLTAFEKAGWETDLYTSAGPGFLDEAPVSRRFKAWYRWVANPYLRLLFFMLSQFMVAFRLLKYWNQPVVIYANTILPFGAGLAGWLMGKPVLYHVHETVFQPLIFTKFLLAVMKKAAHRLLFVSQYLQTYHALPDMPQGVLYNALETAFTQKAAAHPEKAHTAALSVLMVCSLKKAKGIFEFLEIAGALPAHRFTLVISQEQPAINHFLGGAYIPKNVNIFPVQKDLHPFYAQHQVFLSLSHPIEWPETFGMAIVEAMSYGLVPIVPEVGAPPEIVRDGLEGFQRDMRKPESIIQVLKRLASDASLYEGCSQASRKRTQSFSIESYESEIRKQIHILCPGRFSHQEEDIVWLKTFS
ncbi:MAG: glycosyltransferase family 4 protein [Bacteroidota bacterium]